MAAYTYDVIILGSGIGGSTTAAILARQGFRVLMVEKARHPRFALGEATLPQTSYWMWLISERYGVPELRNLADARTVASAIAPTSGIKRSLGFVYHRDGMPQDIVRESHQLLPPDLPFVSESHFYREDIDLYMARVAEKYGAELREGIEVASVETGDDGVLVTDSAGAEYRGRYLVDASGFNSLVGRTFGLKEEPTRLRTMSRSIFTHVEGLNVYDELFAKSDLPGYKYRWHDGTLHHIFDGGWFWIIPFGNHCDSTNTKASIGLTLDMRKFPMRDGVSAEEEFREIVSRFPTVARHLEGSVAVRPYVSTGRLQYSHRAAVGKRFHITAQAYGAVDALYSRGMISTFEMIYIFTNKLIGALRDDDFSEERFDGIDELARKQLDMHDQMVSTSYRAFADFDAWSAWLKVWLAGKLYGDLWLFRSIMQYMGSRDRGCLDELDTAVPPYAAQLQMVVDRSAGMLKEAEDGARSWKSAASGIIGLLRACDWLPHHVVPFGKPDAHHVDLTPPHKMPLVIAWGKTLAPKWVRRELYNFPPSPLIKLQMGRKSRG